MYVCIVCYECIYVLYVIMYVCIYVSGNLGNKVDGGSQVEHVLSHLAAAWTRKGGVALARSRSYQVVYHPAMSMIDMYVKQYRCGIYECYFFLKC